MIDFPITDLLDDAASTQWLKQHLHPNGVHCPHCGSADRRFFRHQESFDAYRCRDCDGYYTILTGTAFAKTQQALGNLDAAIADYTYVLELRPDRAGALYDRAQAYADLGNMNQARDDYQLVIQLSDDQDLIQKAETALQNL